jgi:hypothetical protein
VELAIIRNTSLAAVLENCWIDCQEDAAWQLAFLVAVPGLKTYSVAPLIADKKQTSVASCEGTPEGLEQRVQAPND